MKYTTFASLAVVTALGFLTPMHANAFGLGKIELSSALNEPFKAEIGVTALREDDATNLEIRLASNDEFIKAGLDRSLILTQLKFELVERPKGLVILITSEQSVKEPFLDFLLMATTGQGRLIREYTVLLDPPKEVFNRPVEMTSTPVPKATTSKSTSRTSKPKRTDYQYPSADLSSATSYGPTGRTDTLWDIALKTRSQTTVSVHQMMLAIVKQNPRAFSRDNINGLKAGYTLELPSVDVIEQLSKAQAIAAVLDQNALWKNRHKTKVPAPANTAVSQSNVQANDNVGQEQNKPIEAVEMPTASSADNETEAHLKLVVPAEEASMNDNGLSLSGNKDLKKLSEQLTLAEETLEGQVQENIDIKARMSVMEEQLETMRRLISLKDADFARLQSALEQDQKVESSEGIDSLHQEAIALLDQYAEAVDIVKEGDTVDQEMFDDAGEPVVSAQDSDEISANELLPSDDSSELVEQAVSENALDEIDLSNVPFAEDIISKTSALIQVDEGEIKSNIAKATQFVEQHKIETALGGVLILLLLLLLIRNRKNAGVSWDEAVEKLEGTPTPAPPVMKGTQQTGVEEDILVSETSEDLSAENVNIKTTEDLIEQADIFVGYADYEQAKTSLDLAKQLEPDNEKVIQKLLFVSFKQQDVDAFIDLADQTIVDKDSAEWVEISAWGRELAPEHDMFKLDETEVEIASDGIDEDISTDSEKEEEFGHLEFNLDDIEMESGDIEDTTLDESSSIDDSDDELLAFDVDINSTNDAEAEIEVLSSNDDAVAFSSDNVEELSLEDEIGDFDTPLTKDITSLDSDEALAFDAEPMTLDLTDPESDLGSIELDALGVISEQDLDAATRELSESLDDAVEMDESSDTADLKFDIGEIDEIDEAETKLDLAAAYLDMGDPEGARNILEEVMTDANDEQKERAKSMLNDLSS
ncbi:MAG: hypothetical protein COB23_07335 [Methylophaga sp.]|nr:hypothetical protein [Gammaproteobacteria bacterium]PHS69156.1 MAG: hypothetical protein COB23_07335 [Methylophaga sp.]